MQFWRICRWWSNNKKRNFEQDARDYNLRIELRRRIQRSQDLFFNSAEEFGIAISVYRQIRWKRRKILFFLGIPVVWVMPPKSSQKGI